MAAPDPTRPSHSTLATTTSRTSPPADTGPTWTADRSIRTRSELEPQADDGRSPTSQLVTLSRTVTNIDKDRIFDFLMASGAVVKQVRTRSQPRSRSRARSG